MKTTSRIILAFLTTISISCIDEYSIVLPAEEPRLVVDALITTIEDESSITIGWTFAPGDGCFEYDPWSGSPHAVPCAPDTSSEGEFLVTGLITIMEEDGPTYNYPLRMHDKKSHVTIPMPEIRGVPGKEYSLEIQISYKNETTSYTAETFMPDTPLINSISYVIRKGDIGKEDNFVPLINFNEPQGQKNYYVFKLCQAYPNGERSIYCGNSRAWPYSIMNDDFLPPVVRGLSIDDGATVAKYAEFYPHVYFGVGAEVRMYAVTEETYNFYKALLEQFNNDGGAFSPTPTTPRGNLTGGAIGIFRACDESSAEVFYE
jgi:hypothetical protein